MSDEPLEPPITAEALGIALGRIAQRLGELYAEGSVASLSAFTEISILSRLDRDGAISPGSLAEVEHVTPEAVDSLLSELEQRGLVKRTHGPAEGKKVIVAITHAGRRALHDRACVMTGQLGSVLESDLGPDEHAQLAATLPLLEHIADRL